MRTPGRFEPPFDANDLGEMASHLATWARDAAYAAVGVGLLGFQRAQVRRQELIRSTAAVDDRLGQLRAVMATGLSQVDEWFESTLQLVESGIRPIEEQLPAPARELAGKAISQARDLSTQLRQLVSPGN